MDFGKLVQNGRKVNKCIRGPKRKANIRDSRLNPPEVYLPEELRNLE